MTTALDTTAGPAAQEAEESELLLRVLSALLREDVVGLRTRGTLLERPDGRWLRLPAARTPVPCCCRWARTATRAPTRRGCRCSSVRPTAPG